MPISPVGIYMYVNILRLSQKEGRTSTHGRVRGRPSGYNPTAAIAHVQYGSDTRYNAFAFYTHSCLVSHVFGLVLERMLLEL